MALKTIMLRHSLDKKNAELAALREKDSEFETRENELAAAIEEAQTQEEEQTVAESVEQFEGEKKEHEEAKEQLMREIEALDEELKELERKAPKDGGERKDEKAMATRVKFFGMDAQERDIFFAREDVKDFLGRVRELKGQKRSIKGGELTIPTVVLDLLRENIKEFSKLYKHVRVRKVDGKARQVVMGVVPEAVWTEACANLNELNISFGSVEVDAYKVGGFVPVCNALLEDSDVNLAYELITELGKSIGKSVDKAVLYGTGTKMPMGIMTRLAQATNPNDSRVNVPWKNLSASNIVAITGKSDTALFKALIEATGAAKGDYSNGEKFWAMNAKTRTKLLANAISFNAAGALVAGVDGQMPVVGGAIEVINDVPDDVIVGGYGDLYLLAERAGADIGSSEHARYVEDQTVFKATARYDGMPAIAEGFVAIGINGNTPAASDVTFAADEANTVSEG